MSIFILEPNGRTNTAKYVGNILYEQVRVLTSKGSVYPKNYELPIFENYRISGSIKKLGIYLKGWFRTIFILERGDIFHFHWLKFSPLDFIFIFFLKWRGVKIVGTVHNLLPHESRFYDRFFIGRIYNLSHTLIFHTEGIKDTFKKEFSRSGELCIISHYYDPVTIEKHKEAPKKILFFGNIRRYKGLELLIEAIKILPTSNEWELCIAGNPEYDISDLIEQTSEYTNIHWRNRFIETYEVGDLFNEHGIIVMPYRKIDTSGLLYLAKSYGKLIIAPRMGIFQETIEHMKNGLLFEPNNIESLSEMIQLALKSDVFEKIKSNISSELPVNSINDFRMAHQKLYKSLEKD